jgi:quercetin dioxygenase-like cupin family protein
MKIENIKSLNVKTENCCIKTTINELTSQETGAHNINIKIFEMQSGGYSPLHQHTDQHRLFITGGKGTLSDGEKTTPIQTDDIVHIEANEPHQLKTVGEEPLKFICLTINSK